MVIASSLPAVVLVVIFLVRDAYQRLSEKSDQLGESRTRIVEVADAARRSLERDRIMCACRERPAPSPQITATTSSIEAMIGYIGSTIALITPLSSGSWRKPTST